MTVDFAAGGEEFLVVGFDFSRPGPVGTGVMEQRGTGFVGEVAEVHVEDAAPRRAFAALKITEVGERFSRGGKAETMKFSLIGFSGELFQQALYPGGSELAAHRAGRVLERLNAVDDEQGAFAGDSVREQAAFVPRRKRRLKLHAEPGEGVGEEGVFGGLAVFLGALAIEAPRLDAPCAEPVLLLEVPQPMLDEHTLANASPRHERDNGGVRLGEGKVEEREFLFAANEFFFAQAGTAREREFVEVVANVALAMRNSEWGKFGKGASAKFHRNFSCKLAKNMLLICLS